MLSDPRVIRLFELLLDKSVSALEPVLAPRRDGWVSYPFVESALGVDAEHAAQLLDDLHDLGYLERQFADRINLCPACNSQDLKLITVCPKCSSRHVVRLRMVEHRNCGYCGPEADFHHSGVRLCPKCRVELALIGSDYIMTAPRLQCRDCGHSADTMDERWLCGSCRRLHARTEVRELVLYSYVLDRAQLARLRVERIPKARVREFLVREGYEVSEAARETGRSGAEHEIDLLASKQSGPLQHRVVVGFASADEAVDSEEVVKLYAKAYDVNAQDIIMVASPKLSEDAEQFARHYHIRVFNADALDRLGELQFAG